MNSLIQLIRKKKRTVIGLMSGTSVDSISAALVDITGSGVKTKFRQREFIQFPLPKKFSRYVIENSLQGKSGVEAICRLNFLIAHYFADAVAALLAKANVKREDVDLIGSHGQTVHHLPEEKILFGKAIRSTIQIGDPSVIAKLTGIVTVGDFRVADMALGGQGAPLVPFFDYVVFRSAVQNRLLLNLGGIANITLLPKKCSLADIRAFDTGPANMIIDALMKKLYKKMYDADGAIAAGGDVIPFILSFMARHSYFERSLPKSTGREIFGEQFVARLLPKAKIFRKENIIATATEFTALTVFDQYRRFLMPICRADEVIVSGGGMHNRTLMTSLKKYFYPARVTTTEAFGVSGDSKEAICFALLANETISGNPSNVPGATGTKQKTILGKICL